MKQLLKVSILSSVLFNQAAFALDPIQGFYGSIFGELSHGPLSYFISLPPPNNNLIGRVNNSQIGAGGGASLGYRFENFRAEGEMFYNWISAGTLEVGDCTLQSPAVKTPTPPDDCFDNDKFFKNNKTGFNGSTTSIFAMANAFYDFYTFDSESTIVPYVGLGIGAGRIMTRVNVINTVFPPIPPVPPGTQVSAGEKALVTSSAAQGILGVNVFIDDYTSAGMDFRYLTTGNINYNNANPSFLSNNSRYSLAMVNINVNFAFDNTAN